MDTNLLFIILYVVTLISSYLSSERVIYYNNKIIKITNQLNEKLKSENSILQKENEEWKVKTNKLADEIETLNRFMQLTLSTLKNEDKYPIPYDVICGTSTNKASELSNPLPTTCNSSIQSEDYDFEFLSKNGLKQNL